MAASTLELRIDAAAIAARIGELSSLLEHATKSVRDDFLCRLDGLLSQDGNCRLTRAPGAGDDICGLQLYVGGLDELCAAARRAAELDGI